MPFVSLIPIFRGTELRPQIYKNDDTKISSEPLAHYKTEHKILEWLTKRYPGKITYHPTYEWCISPNSGRRLEYDFAIAPNIICELDGAAHFRQVSNWRPPESRQKTDVFKMVMALSNGFTVIRITQPEVYHDEIPWKEMLEKTIQYHTDHFDETICTYICIHAEYEIYKKLMLQKLGNPVDIFSEIPATIESSNARREGMCLDIPSSIIAEPPIIPSGEAPRIQ